MIRPRQGDVWSYDYLWRRQHETGEEHGRKPVPTALVATVFIREGRTNLFILPITSMEPGKDRHALEVPEIERARAGQDPETCLWVLLDEYNHDVLETSFYLNPGGRLGAFSPAFTGRVLSTLIASARPDRA